MLTDWIKQFAEERKIGGWTNEQIQAAAHAAFDAQEGPRVGDFVRMNGEVRRFTHRWDHGLQTTWPELGGSESFHMSVEGLPSYSGALDHALPLETLHLTKEKLPGTFWHFDRGIARAHSAVHYQIPCRVYEYRP